MSTNLLETLEVMETLHELDGNYEPDKIAWKDLSDKQQMDRCTHQSGIGKLYKMPGGGVGKQPIYCNKCEACYVRNALKLKERIDGFSKQLEQSDDIEGGHWRKKTVNSDGPESASLKRHISRNQKGRYFETACNFDTNDIYVYVIDEPGKDMDKIYGEKVNLEDIDYDEMYQRNRCTGKKLSKGKGFKTLSSSKKKNTIRVKITQFVIAGDEKEAEKIIRETNYLHLAETALQAKNLFNYQTKYIIQELESSNIEVSSIDYKFYNFEADKLLSEWNQNVTYWMSINASQDTNKREASMDNLTSRLYQKAIGEPEKLAN